MILDIRSTQEYAEGHIEGAVLVPTPRPPLSLLQRATLRARLESVTATLPRGSTVAVYCKKGVRSALAASMLRAMGYDVVDWGGIEGTLLPALVARGEVSWSG